MTPILARLRQAARWAIALAVLVGAGFAGLVVLYFRRRAYDQLPDPVDRAFNRWNRETTVASARAAVQIAAGRAVQADERDRLIEILKDEDEDRRNDRLIEEARRIRGE